MTTQGGHRVVVLTPPGTGAIGVVRVVGPDAVSLVNQAFRPASGSALSAAQGDRLRYGHFVDGEETIDDVIVSLSSIKGRPAIDISAHGGVRIIERVLQTLERLGALVGEPGEAVGLAWPTENIIEYEALEALTRAKTERGVRFLAWQREYLPAALEALAHCCHTDPPEALRRLKAIADGYPVARTLVEGVTVALVGPPNSGKSTLFNRLIGRPATVVSSQPGTTRDWVAEPVEMDGVPVTLVDTAGRREADDPLEQQAVEAGRRVMERAEVRLLLLDGSQIIAPADAALFEISRRWAGCLTVINKADAGIVWPTSKVGANKTVLISALTGAGCDDLVSKILEVLGFRGWVERVPCLFTARQAEAAADVLSVLPRDRWAAGQRLEQVLIGRCKQVTPAGSGI